MRHFGTELGGFPLSFHARSAVLRRPAEHVRLRCGPRIPGVGRFHDSPERETLEPAASGTSPDHDGWHGGILDRCAFGMNNRLSVRPIATTFDLTAVREFAATSGRTLLESAYSPEWRNGRRRGLKIPRGLPSCGFDSHLRH